MYAIEFVTSIKDGIVHIPSQYKELQQKESAKILIMVEERDKDILSAEGDINKMGKSENTDKFFDKFQIDMTDYKFNRDESNKSLGY